MKQIIDYMIKDTIKSWLRIIYSFFIPYIQDYFFRIYFVFKKVPKRNTKYYFSICCIFKNESLYLREWIEYQKIIGVDHIYAYNNDSEDNYLEVVTPYVEEGYVTLIQFPGEYAQFPAYSHCLGNYGKETFWLSFVDLDEFIVPKTHTDIKEWIKPYEKYPSVVFYWLMFGTNGILDFKPNELVIEQFTNSFDTIRNVGKIALNTSYVPVKMYHHSIFCWEKILWFKVPVATIDEHKHFVFFYPDHKVNSKYSIQMNHYWSKCLSEYVRKIDKGDMVDKHHDEIRKKMDFFYWHERQNVREEKTIYRFLIELKVALNGINIKFRP